MSFYQLIHDVPLTLSLISLALVVIPSLLYFSWKKGYIQPVYSSLHNTMFQFNRTRVEAEVNSRIKYDYSLFLGKKIKIKDILGATYFLGTVLIGLMLINKMLFFSLVLTQSMFPVLHPADLVLMESISKEVHVGDVVMFHPPNEPNPIIHRVTFIEDGILKTKGDVSSDEDEWITPINSVLGKTVTISGKPIVVKNFGLYFMPRRFYVPGSDPTLEFIQSSVKFGHEYGPLIAMVIILLALILSFEGKKYAKVYDV